MNKITRIGRSTYYKRNDTVWPWGYYRPHSSPKKKDGGHFVASSEAEAKRKAARYPAG